ncbi:MAG: RsmE family RNA methyltransferase [bacterium]
MSLYLEQDFLSNVELYYTPPKYVTNKSISLSGDEFLHAFKVMRNNVNDELFSTDGEGNIYKSKIERINKEFAELDILEIKKYNNLLSNITLYIPNLKNSDRFEFALEKCVELGIINFVVYNSDRTFSKGFKKERLEKIILAAMKQSLRSFLPKIDFLDALNNYKSNNNTVLLDQSSSKSLYDFFYELKVNNNNEQYNLIIGPEGGFSNREYGKFTESNKLQLSLNRLRSETACIVSASLLNKVFEN